VESERGRRYRPAVGSEPLRNAGIALALLAALPSAALGMTAPPGTTTATEKLVKKTLRPSGAIYLSVRVNSPGQLSAVGLYGPGSKRAGAASAGRRMVVPKPFGSAVANPSAPGTVVLKLKPSRSARAVLRRRHRLLVYLTVVLLPPHGSAVTLRTHAIARLKAARRR
jgi:hypothetical protein